MNWAIQIIRDLVAQKYSGKIEINFQFGGITNINKFESLKPPKESK